jgi:UDP-2,3-diacylglucosamine pyrophosphatase LpxH
LFSDGGMMNVAQYDDLYVISDLHMGGSPGFQIMNRGQRLASFIRQLAARPTAESAPRVGLVINGDAIDTLAEDFDGYIAVTEAERILERLYDDDAFAPVWSALAAFVQQTRGRLVFTIGNHDIELALPAVQFSIRRRLAGDDDAARGRIEFAVDGAGYTCVVGDRRIFCSHGNEVDGWNVIDHGALTEVVRDRNAGVRFNAAAWTPNAGTRLVRDVMNRVKRRHPWIDLLKPEKNVVLGVLLTLDPSVVRNLPTLVPVAWHRGIGELQRHGLLSAAEGSGHHGTAAAEPAEWRDAVGPQLQHLIDGTKSNYAMAAHGQAASVVDPMLLEVERQLAAGMPVADSVNDLEGTLGWRGMLLDRLQSVDRIDALRRALLDWHADDRSSELTDQDETYHRTLAHVGPDVDVIVTGHTHLERAIVTRGRAYYNTGSWTRLIRLPEVLLKDPFQFAQVYQLLDQATLANLDTATVRGSDGQTIPLVTDVTTALQITARGGSVVASLGHVVDDAREGARFELVPGSEFRSV